MQAVLPNSVGRPTVLTLEEENMIVKGITFAAQRGFALTVPALKIVMAKIAADGRPGWLSRLPCDDAVTSFRARHSEITFRKSENKDSEKLKGENFELVLSYVTALKQVDTVHPGIFRNADRLWNMHETKVDAEFGKIVKVLGPPNTHQRGLVSSTSAAGSRKHVTYVIAISASGLKAPPFFIVAGKNRMSKWFEPLNSGIYKFENGRPHPLSEHGWCPDDACVAMTENGSMQMDVMPMFIEHINSFVRRTVNASLHYIFCLDGHSSRKGIKCLELCIDYKCEVIQSPANTSHFLQPCDNAVNKYISANCKNDERRSLPHGFH